MKALPTTKNTNAFMVSYLLGVSAEELERKYPELYELTDKLELLEVNKRLRVFRNLQLLRIDLVHGKHVPFYEIGQMDYFFNRDKNEENANIIAKLREDGINVESFIGSPQSAIFIKLTAHIESEQHTTLLEAGVSNPTAVWSLFHVKGVKDSKSFRKYRGIIDKNIFMYFGGNKYFIFNTWRNAAYYRDTMLDNDKHLYHDVAKISGTTINEDEVMPCKYFLEDSDFIKLLKEQEEKKKIEENKKTLQKNKIKPNKVDDKGLSKISDSIFYVDSDNLSLLQIVQLITNTQKNNNKYRLYYDNSSHIQWGLFLQIFDNKENIEFIEAPRLLNNKSVVDMQIYKDIILNGKDVTHVIVSSDSDFFIATYEGYNTKVIYNKVAVSDTYLEYLEQQNIEKFELNDTLYGDSIKKHELLVDLVGKLMVIKMVDLPMSQWNNQNLRLLLHKDVTEILSENDVIITSSLTDEITKDIMDNVEVTYKEGNFCIKLQDFEYKG